MDSRQARPGAVPDGGHDLPRRTAADVSGRQNAGNVADEVGIDDNLAGVRVEAINVIRLFAGPASDAGKAKQGRIRGFLSSLPGLPFRKNVESPVRPIGYPSMKPGLPTAVGRL